MKYFNLFFFLLISYSFLHAAEMAPALMSCIEGVPEGKVEGVVDVITGQFVDVEVDLYVAGPDPLVLQRNYESADFAFGKSPGNWRLLSHCFLVTGEDKSEKGCVVRGQRHIQQHAFAGERLGSFLWYSGWKNIQNLDACSLKLMTKEHLKGITNCATEEISARSFSKNNQMPLRKERDFIEILSGDGTLRLYRVSIAPNNSLFANTLLESFASLMKNVQFYHLVEEILPSGNHIVYEYNDEGNPSSISIAVSHEVLPFSTISFEYTKDDVIAKADDGRKVTYHFRTNNKMVSLEKVNRPEQPDISYTYDSKTCRLIKKCSPDGSFLQVVYDSNGRVKLLKDPDGEQVNLSYLTDSTCATFVSGIVKEFRYDSDKRLSLIDTFTPEKTLYHRECWQWETDKIRNGMLKFKIFEDSQGNIHRCQKYTYDEKGNLVEESVFGNLTGKPQETIHYKSDGTPDLEGSECHKKTYSYSQDQYNLLVKQGDCKGNEIVFDYKPNTNLLTAKYHLEKDSVRKRFFYEYNSSGVRIQEIEDDGSPMNPTRVWGCGVSCRHITRTTPNEKGYPLIVEKVYRSLEIKGRPYSTANGDEEFLITKIINTFDSCGRMLRQETFDAECICRFFIECSYDRKGNLTSQSDPAGQTTFYTYDSCNQKLTEHRPYQNKLIEYQYDLKGRCTAIRETFGDFTFISQNAFDVNGNKITTIDRYGNKIDFKYDPFGRVIEAIYPLVFDEKYTAVHPSFKYSYDISGNYVEVVDAKGYKTKKVYNARGQPIRIDYPDKSYEIYKYDAEGSLHRQSTRDQTIYVFEYDYLGRLVRKERSTYNPDGAGSWISTVSNEYNAFHKIRSKNERGYTTLYQYDGAGRLTAEIKPENSGATNEDSGSHKKEFIYDGLNRLSAIKTWYGDRKEDFALRVQEYDLLGQTVQEMGEDASGTVFWKKGYVYDVQGNLTQKISYIENKPCIEAQTTFDFFGNLISLSDTCGHSFRIQYDYAYLNSLGQRVLKKTIIDPIKAKNELTYDALGRLCILGQYDSKGKELLKREILYDVNGNKSVEVTTSSGKTFRIEWTYGPMNRLESVKKAAGTLEEKTTIFTYNERGQLSSRLDPGATTPIVYTYNREGMLEKVAHQAEKTVDLSNRYSYDRNGNITEADTLGRIGVYREYDAFDQLVQEKFKDENGSYVLGYAYDKMGRRTEVVLPDGSSLCYTYDAFFPRSASRFSKSGACLFTHSYDHFDQQGRLTLETCFGFCGDQKISYDLAGIKTSLASDFIHDFIVNANQAGEILQMETRIEESIKSKNFCYDSLGQLVKEPEHSYSFDGLRNRISKDQKKYILNEANQLLSDDALLYSYDFQGRLIKKGELKFDYNPLGDLVSVENDEMQIMYTYDAFGRRLGRTQYKLAEKRKTKVSVDRFLYLGCEEIGRLQNNELLECKILGAFEEPLAIEERGEFLVAFCDLQGNLVALADPETREILGSAQWSAFGEKNESYGRQSSWGYRAKREDPFTKLVAFGRRDYDACVGRWTTPDPAGFVDGPNLYQYAWNNPLSFHDRWGLSSGHEDYIYGEVEAHCYCERHRDCKRGGDFDNINPHPYPSAPTYTYQGALWNPSKRFDLSDIELPELPKGQIGFINGMATKFTSARDHALYLSRLAGGYNIHAVYNATHTAAIDFFGCANELYHFTAPAPVCKLHQNWDAFFSKAGDKELYLQFCFSEGAILIRNALLDYPNHLRKKIIVVAIAPGAYIPKEICYRPVHYESRDLIPQLDRAGRRMCQDTIVHLTPHPQAHLLDHDFQSKTFERVIRNEFDKYLILVQQW